MNKNILISAAVFLFVLVGGYLLFVGGSSSGPADGGASGTDAAGEAGGSGTQLSDKPGSDSISSLNGSPDKDTDELVVGESGLAAVRYVSLDGDLEVSSQEQAQDLVDQQSEALGIAQPSALTVIDNTEDGLGNSYYQIDQYYAEIPVYGANALLEVSNNQAAALSGIWEENIELNPEPTYSAEEALAIAANNLGSTQETALQFLGPPTLVVYISNLNAHLAWHMKAKLFAQGEYEEIIVDAHNPDFLLQVSLELH